MAKRPERYDANLPRNLTFRKRDHNYAWRNPITGQEFSLGRISRREAVAQAIEANNYLEQNYLPSSLLDRIKEIPDFNLSRWLDRYFIIMDRRELKPNTMKVRRNQIATIKEEFGSMPLDSITTRHIANFLEGYIESGKKSMAVSLRSVLSDIFREAIVAGYLEKNPVDPTRAPTPDVKRERLSLDNFQAMRITAELSSPWIKNAMDLALSTGQRREDIAKFKFSDIRENRLFVDQEKTGAKLAIPLDLKLKAVGMVLGDVIDQCRINNLSDYLVFSNVRRGGRRPGPLTADGLTQAFSGVRDASGVQFSANPPSFHEMRSLAGRLYEAEYGEEFAQKLLGHKNLSMTKKYLDARGSEYVMI
ncbi:tyrosine-type recombinase/integrase [Sodalis sp. RH24]|uniref:tyrosine-type recombinase/integrase n=1 Tax=unclassified Sodalis (in: enterobacteria) TaxID=2636512 RepID=UPI0039B47B49